MKKSYYDFSAIYLLVLILLLSQGSLLSQDKKNDEKTRIEKSIPDKTNSEKKTPKLGDVNPPFLPISDAVSSYAFTYSAGTYSSIAGTVSTATGDDGTQLLTLPFTFNYDGINYTQITISTNGAIGMGTLNPSYSNNLASTSTKPVIGPLWDDLYDDATSNLQYTTQGTTPNRIYVIQWTGILWYYSGGTRQNFQVRLYETTNVIQFIYGAMLAPAGTPSASIGISDAVGGSSHFISITPAVTPTYSTTVSNNSINAVTYLTSGRTYTFTPPGYCAAGASTQDEAITNVTVGTINNTTTWSTGGYGNYTALSTSMSIGTGYNISVNVAPYYSGDITGVWVDWNQNYSFLDAGEYFTTSATNPAIGTITPPISALTGTTRMRIRMQYTGTLTPCGTTTYGEVEDYTINVTASTTMTFVSSTTTQTVTSIVSPASANNQIIGIQIVTTGASSPFNATSFTLNTTGSTNPPVDITNGKIWYTGTSSVFATTSQFGSTAAAPNGTFTINGTQALQTGTNYFWLTYDIPGGATSGNVVDAQCTQIVMSGAGGTRVPSVTAPAGNRAILCASTVGTGTLTASYPFATYWMDSRTDLLYTAAEISATTCASGCKYITGIGFNVSSYDSYLMNGFNIKMQSTSATSLSAFTSSGWTTVYSGTYSVAGTGWQYITLTTPFPWNGTSNVLIEICYNNTDYSDYSYVYSSTTAANTAYYSFTDLPSGDGCSDITSGTATTTRPNIQFVIGSTPPAMSFTSSTGTQNNTSTVGSGTTNAEIIGIQVVVAGLCSPMNVTNFNLNTTGCTNAAGDLTAAKIFYTGTSSTFSAATQFGTTYNNPNGSYSITGTQALTAGTNYFWLAYNINGSATTGHVVDGECTSVTVGGTPRTPSVTAPAGSRTIIAPLSGGILVGIGQPYTTLTGAGGLFEAINTAGLVGNITAYITSNITEPGTFSLNQWIESSPGGYSLSIYPYDAGEKIISGSVASGLIKFNGTDRVLIDGNGGIADAIGTKFLRFRNTNGSAPAMSFTNDARSNTITDCYIESNNTNTAVTSAGTVYFGNTTGANGNDSNTFSYCDIRDRSDAAGVPVYAVFSNGTTSTTNTYNSNIIIDNCNIYNFFADAGLYYAGIWLDAGTTDWTITNNSLYQTSTRTQNTGAVIVYIFNNYNSANNLTVQGNYIGGTSPLCGGTPLTYTGTGAYAFTGMYLYIAGATASNIQGNTIQNISLTSNNAVSGSTIFRGIITGPSTALCNIGTVTGNTIGSGTGTGSITINTPLAVSNGFTTIGIEHDGLGNINNNIIGSITLSGASSSAGTSSFIGIYRPSLTPGSATTFVINNNLIGSLTTPNSIQQTNTTRPGTHRGIVAVIYSPGALNITNNTMANVTDFNTSLVNTSSIYGIQNSLGSSVYTITGNTFRDLTEGCGVPSSILLCGISNSGTASKTISQNNIYNFFLNQPGAGGSNITGIHAGGTPGGGTISRNKIYNFVNSNSGAAQSIYGIWTQTSTSSLTISNNMMALTNGDASLEKQFTAKRLSENPKMMSRIVDYSSINNYFPAINNNEKFSSATSSADIKSIDKPAETYKTSETVVQTSYNKKSENNSIFSSYAANGVYIYGLLNAATGPVNNYYNTVYIGGTQPGGVSFPSYALYSSAGIISLQNNLFINARTGGTGNHVVLGNLAGTPSAGWTATASNYNALIGSSANTIGEWGSGVMRTIGTWRTSSGGDKQTWCVTIDSFTVPNLLNNISAGDLTVNTANSESWFVSGKGIAVLTENTDLAGDSRVTAIASGVTDIGADEFSTPSANPPNAVVDNAPGTGIISSYSLWGRTIAVVTWGEGGVSYPSALNVKYFSGVNPENALSGGFSNSHWNITPIGTLSGGTYNILLNFGVNETYSIGTPSTYTRLAKYDETWEVFPAGSGGWQTQLTWNASASIYSVYVTSLDRFSAFTLTDGQNPLPVLLTEFKASVNKRDVILTWVTESELNNAGFSVERRNLLNATKNFSDWQVIGFVNGKGTVNSISEYKYTNKKLNTGTYQYRLKQTDINGNFEYYTLTSPENVIVGKPVSADVSQNYPNPSNPKSTIEYQVPYEAKITIMIYDILGREVAVLVNEIKKEGFYSVEFDGTNIASGTYFYRLVAEGSGEKFTKTLKMILVK